MSKNIDNFCSSLRDRLNAVESRLDSAKASLQSLPEKTEEALRKNLDELRTSFEKEKGRAKQLQKGILSKVEGFVEDTKESIMQWQANRETVKLKNRADRKEQQALDSIEFALFMVGNAEESILEAAIARADALDDASTHHAAVS